MSVHVFSPSSLPPHSTCSRIRESRFRGDSCTRCAPEKSRASLSLSFFFFFSNEPKRREETGACCVNNYARGKLHRLARYSICDIQRRRKNERERKRDTINKNNTDACKVSRDICETGRFSLPLFALLCIVAFSSGGFVAVRHSTPSLSLSASSFLSLFFRNIHFKSRSRPGSLLISSFRSRT